jgi:hypothetical protein
MLKKYVSFFIFLLLSSAIFAQKDSIKLANGNVLIGEVKSLDQSVLVFKTPYSDSDFNIKWSRVKELYSKRIFIISLVNGDRLHSSITTDSIDVSKVILIQDGEKIKTELNKIIFIDPFASKFLSRLEFSIDAGITLTKANNAKQITSNASLAYTAFKWNYLSSFNLVYSKQDSTDNISRFQGDITVQRFLKNEWFLQGLVDLLSSSDQKIKLRTTGSLGAGYYFKKNNNLSFGGGSGLAINNESYFDDPASAKSSLEAYVGSEFNKYDIGDLSLQTTAVFYPSLTEKGRVRLDFNFNLKYDITSNLYIKSGITYNFDNQPVEGASKGDYTFQTTFGWDNN